MITVYSLDGKKHKKYPACPLLNSEAAKTQGFEAFYPILYYDCGRMFHMLSFEWELEWRVERFQIRFLGGLKQWRRA